MSRTDKDLPYWYAEYYEPYHFCTEFGSRNSTLVGSCDLPTEPIVQSTAHHVRFSNRSKNPDKIPAENIPTRCGWEPVHPNRSNRFRNWYDKNPSWWLREVWTRPTRRMVRDMSTKALQDYNANGHEDFEYDIPNFRRKHEGGWYW